MAPIPEATASAFVEVAHRIVWCSVATVDARSRPRSRVLHPLWKYVDGRLTGVIATGPTPIKVSHLATSPYLSCSYWDQQQDVATAECRATWATDDETCERVWNEFVNAPEPVGYDPAIVPPWSEGPTSDAFAVLQLEPWLVRVFPGTLLLEGTGEVLTWSDNA